MLGEQIKALRQARGITQTSLALRLGVSKQSVSNWENNNIMPSIDMLVKMAQFFHCTTDYLLEIGDESFLIETHHLTEKQAAHILFLVDEFERLNTEKKTPES